MSWEETRRSSIRRERTTTTSGRRFAEGSSGLSDDSKVLWQDKGDFSMTDRLWHFIFR